MSLSENAYHATKWQHYVADLSVHKPFWLFPLFVMIFFPLSSLSAYVSAVIHGQVPAFLPYISEAITLPPQAGYYTFYLSINAFIEFMGLMVLYCQLKYLIDLLECKYKRLIVMVNTLSVFVAIAHTICQIGASAFRSREHPFVHVTIAVLAFMSLVLHHILFWFVLYQLSRNGLIPFPTLELISCLLLMLNLGASFVTRIALYWLYNKYTPSDGLQEGLTEFGDVVHDLSAGFQWISVLLIALYFSCILRFIRNFPRIYKQQMLK